MKVQPDEVDLLRGALAHWRLKLFHRLNPDEWPLVRTRHEVVIAAALTGSDVPSGEQVARLPIPVCST